MLTCTHLIAVDRLELLSSVDCPVHSHAEPTVSKDMGSQCDHLGPHQDSSELHQDKECHAVDHSENCTSCDSYGPVHSYLLECPSCPVLVTAWCYCFQAGAPTVTVCQSGPIPIMMMLGLLPCVLGCLDLKVIVHFNIMNVQIVGECPYRR